jgi:hypothetical protein
LAYVVLVGLGLLNCFAGYRLFRVLLGIWGFLGGAAIAITLLQGTRLDPLVQIVIAALGGIVGAALVSVLYLVGVFLFGAGFGLLVASVIEQHVQGVPARPLLIILGIVGGVAALALQRPLITLFTAFGGAWVVVACVAALVAGCPLETFPAGCLRASPWVLVILATWLFLGLCGFATQTRFSRGRARRRAQDD